MIIKGIFRRYEKWNPVHPTYGAFWGMGIGIGCGVGWGPGFGPKVIGYVGAGCGVGFSVGITLAGIGIGLPTNFLLATPYNSVEATRKSAFNFFGKRLSADGWRDVLPQMDGLQRQVNEMWCSGFNKKPLVDNAIDIKSFPLFISHDCGRFGNHLLPMLKVTEIHIRGSGFDSGIHRHDRFFSEKLELMASTKNETDENQKPSKIDKKLEAIKSSFNKEYNKRLRKDLPTDGDSSSTSKSMSKKEGPKVNRVESRSEVPNHTIHGFADESLFLRNFLLKRKESRELKTLAIVGKYGVGKTTLCQDVFNNKYVREAYFPRIWVSMFTNETIKEDLKIDVVRRILRSLGVEDDKFKYIKNEAKEEKSKKLESGERDEEAVEEKELSQLLNALHLNLIGKKYLIVLDDVWEEDKWDQRLNDEKNQQEKTHLSHGFPKGFGGRVIVTSRDEGLAKKIVGEEDNVMHLNPRSDEEKVLEIYKDEARIIFKEEVDPRYPIKFKRELMDKSCGIPLAARMLAKIRPVKMDEEEKQSNL